MTTQTETLSPEVRVKQPLEFPASRAVRIPLQPSAEVQAIIDREKQKSRMLRLWILFGLLFMVLPGSLVGFTNILSISEHQGLSALPAGWAEGHGHAQVFGWIGSFILGIGFYSQPSRSRVSFRLPLACFLLWSIGVTLRWSANMYGWHWQTLLPLSAALEVIAVALFLVAARKHKLPAENGKKATMELWMSAVLLGTVGLTIAVIFNLIECVRLSWAGNTLAFPHDIDQRYLVVLGWGFLVPFVWGFTARWMPSFLGVPRPEKKLFRWALLFNLAGVLCGVFGMPHAATILLSCGAGAVVVAFHLFSPVPGQAKIQGIHASFPVFIRISYIWFLIAAGLGLWASNADLHGGIWGASRHALTVGFAATMVLSVGPRILPHFLGLFQVYSKSLMFLALLLLNAGCMMRVLFEPLAYEGFASVGWKFLPYSGATELAGILLFASNMILTVIASKPMAQESRQAVTAF